MYIPKSIYDLDQSQYKHSNAAAPDCGVESVADVIHQHLVDDIPYHVVDKLPLVLLAVLPRQGLVDAIQYLATIGLVDDPPYLFAGLQRVGNDEGAEGCESHS